MAATFNDGEVAIRITATHNMTRKRIVIDCPSIPTYRNRIQQALSLIIGKPTPVKRPRVRRLPQERG
jgi:hypothetical protein